MCEAKIRPYRPINDNEVQCTLVEVTHVRHAGLLTDFADPESGSSPTVKWNNTDRRIFYGEWPGQCLSSPECPFPNGHHGQCAVD